MIYIDDKGNNKITELRTIFQRDWMIAIIQLYVTMPFLASDLSLNAYVPEVCQGMKQT
jgi:hypothetical protein